MKGGLNAGQHLCYKRDFNTCVLLCFPYRTPPVAACGSFAFTKEILTIGLSPSKKIHFYLLQWKPFKSDEKCFLFHLKGSFPSKNIQILFLTFWLCWRNALVRKIRLISKFWRHNLFNKQLQYTYCPMSHEVKATRYWNLFR